MALKSASKLTGDSAYDWNYGLKYRVKSDRFSLALASSRSYSAETWVPDAYSGSLAYDFKRMRGRLVFGDFNARYGQGLSLWSGTFMTSLNSPDAFMKKPSGISETWSFTGTSALTGLAGSFSFKRLTFSALAAVPGIKDVKTKPEKLCLKPAMNLSWQGRYGSLSMTHVSELTGLQSDNFRIPVMRTSTDAAYCIRGINLFGEIAYDWVMEDVHLVAGTDFHFCKHGRMAALMKYLPSKCENSAAHHAAAASATFGLGRMMLPTGVDGFGASRRRHTATFSIDAIRYMEPKEATVPLSLQVKLLADWRVLINEHWEAKLRISERIRSWGNRSRTDIRSDIIYMNGHFISTVRVNYLQCVRPAFVGYYEQGYKAVRLSAYMREGIFFVDNWEDRIYVYERDAPGTFNVPAMYGRGWFASAVISAKISYSMRMYFRVSYIGYDFMPYEKRKPGKAELRIQLVLRYL